MGSSRINNSFLNILQCNKCGSNQLYRKDNYFVCPYCGTHYTFDIHSAFTDEESQERDGKRIQERRSFDENKTIVEPQNSRLNISEIRQQKNVENAHDRDNSSPSLQGKRITKAEKAKIVKIANENDESRLEDIVAMLHATRPDKKAKIPSTRSFQNQIELKNDEYLPYIEFLYAIYEYAKKTCSQLRHAIIAESKHGCYTASIAIPAFTKESRRVQDLLIFAGITDDPKAVAKPIGYGSIIAARRQKTLQVFLDKVNEICSSDHIHVDYHLELKDPDNQEFYPCELPFNLQTPMEFPEQICIRAVIRGSYIRPKSVEAISNKIQLSKIDSMNGLEFEHFCAKLLQHEGFSNISITKGSHDQGIDIIATCGLVKYGFQCKCYTADVGNSAIQETSAGKAFYDCHIGVVITNRYFTPAAKELAMKLGVILWDRDYLAQKIDSFSQVTAEA